MSVKLQFKKFKLKNKYLWDTRSLLRLYVDMAILLHYGYQEVLRAEPLVMNYIA